MPGLYPKEIHTANMPWSHAEPQQWRAPGARPFITIAHEAGAEAEWLPQRLAQALDLRQPPHTPAWSQWGQELIKKVSMDSQIPAELIASLDHARHLWIDDVSSSRG